LLLPQLHPHALYHHFNSHLALSFTMTQSSDPGEFWDHQDEVKNKRAEYILRNQEETWKQDDGCRTSDFIPTADSFDEVMDDLMLKTCEALETLDGGITLLHDMTSEQFGTKKKKKKKKKKQRALNVGVEEAVAIREAEKERTRRKEEKAEKKREEAKEKKGFFYNPFAQDPPAAGDEEDSAKTEPELDDEEEDEDGEDLAALETEIGHYIDMLQEHKEEEEQHSDEKSELMGLMGDIERKQHLKALESEDQLIWSSLDANTPRRRRMTNKKAPSPENIIGRMHQNETETEEAREARITRMLDALDRRMAAQTAARSKGEGKIRKTESFRDAYDDGLLFGLLEDFKVFGDLGGQVLKDDCGINLSLLKGSEPMSLEAAEEEYFKEVEESKDPKDPPAQTTLAKRDNQGILQDTRDALLDMPNVCLGGCVAQDSVADARTEANAATYAAGTNADFTNAINSTDVVFNKAGDALEDRSVDNFDVDFGGSRDPPALSWFSFLNPAPEQTSEEPEPMAVPDQIHLDGESRGDGQQEPKEEKPKMPITKKPKKKGLKITAYLEDDSQEQGTAIKPIEMADSHGTFDDMTDSIPCWNMQQKQRLTNE
jgi:hypothetical protein